MVTPRGDIAEIRAAKFQRKADHIRAMGDRKCDPKTYAKIEKGESVRPSIYQYYLAPLDMTLEEGVEGTVDQEGAHSAYVIDEPEILSKISDDFGRYRLREKAITRLRKVARPVGAQEMSSLFRLTGTYEVDGRRTFTSFPIYMVHERVDWSEPLRSTIADLKKAIPKEHEWKVSKNVFHSLDSLLKQMDAFDALQAPLQRLKTDHNLHILGAALATSLGYAVIDEQIGYHQVSHPFFLIAPLTCREAVITFDALVDRDSVDAEEQAGTSDDIPF